MGRDRAASRKQATVKLGFTATMTLCHAMWWRVFSRSGLYEEVFVVFVEDFVYAFFVLSNFALY